ncbi:MAG TPA: DUF6476 family protein [Stellaceae bacterium]|nr:DUF6476 family protein [Stellaceae bacterium]
MNLRFLKILVAAMGVLLVAGVVILVVSIANRVSHRPAPPAAAFTAPPITLPHGGSIEQMSVGSDRIVLHILLADGSAELVVIDLATGRLAGTIPLREAP